MTVAIKKFRTKTCAVKFAEAHNGKIFTSLGGQYFVRYDLEYCPCDTCQTAIYRCGCQMHLCSDYQKWKEGEN